MHAAAQARVAEPGRLDQGQHRCGDDRSRRARRAAATRRHRRRGDPATLGPEVHGTRSDVGKGHPDSHQDVAARLARDIPGAFFADQFNNRANPLAHETGTGPEIWAQTGHDLDAIVVGVGSAGTITRLTRFFCKVQPKLGFVLADPAGSILAEYVRRGTIGEAGSSAVEGIGEDFVPAIADLSGATTAYSISDKETCARSRRSRAPAACSPRTTTPSRAHSIGGRWNSASTSSCTRPPST